MSKLVEAEWQRHSVTMGIPLPRLTASKNRKLAITIHREGGATWEEQVALAKHMAHSVVTADKYYDKSDQREARHHCLDAIHHTIRVSKKLFDIIRSIRQHKQTEVTQPKCYIKPAWSRIEIQINIDIM